MQSNGWERWTRRGVLAATGAVTAGLAGCSESSGSETEDEPLTIWAPGAYDRRAIDFNPYNVGTVSTDVFAALFDALVLPVDEATGEYRTSGHEATTASGDSVSVPCVVEDYELLDSDRVELTLDDRVDYWNGDPLDPEVYRLNDRMDFFVKGGQFTDGTFDHEVVSDTVYRRSVGTPDTNNRFDLRAEVHPGPVPLPSGFSAEWVERFEAASTVEELDDRTEDLFTTNVMLDEFVDEGWGTGAYELRSMDDVSDNAMVGHRREDHPGDQSIETIRIEGMGGGRRGQEVLKVEDDQIDAGRGVITENSGRFDRDPIPEHIQQQTRFPTPRNPGQQLVFDWTNDHLRRLWVRRALVAALPLYGAVQNLVGEPRAYPRHDTGMLSAVDERAFDESFLDSLYDYPVRANTDLAAEWMREAGYSRQGGTWVSPDGEPLELSFQIHQFGRPFVDTVRQGLESFGVTVEVERHDVEDWAALVEGRKFDLTVATTPGGWHRSNYYGDWFEVGDRYAVGSPVTVVGNPLGSCGDDDPIASVPESVTLPETPGALRIEGLVYGDGGARYTWDRGRDYPLCRTVDRIHEEGVSDSEFEDSLRVAARWYNYAVPNFVFVQDVTGFWGDVENYAFSAADPVLRTGVEQFRMQSHYHVQAGTIARDESSETQTGA